MRVGARSARPLDVPAWLSHNLEHLRDPRLLPGVSQAVAGDTEPNDYDVDMDRAGDSIEQEQEQEQELELVEV